MENKFYVILKKVVYSFVLYSETRALYCFFLNKLSPVFNEPCEPIARPALSIYTTEKKKI